MLKTLSIENIAVIEKAEIEFLDIPVILAISP